MNTVILQHVVSFEYDNDMAEIPESEIDHVTEMITDGYISGQLCYCDENDNEVYGWWSIE